MKHKRLIVIALLAGGAAYLLWKRSQAHPDGNVKIGSFVVENGQCYRVDLLASGAKRNVLLPMSACTAANTGDTGLDTVDDPNVGFYNLVHMFDDGETP